MTQATPETTTATTPETQSQPAKPSTPPAPHETGVHALIRGTTGELTIVSARSRTELSRQLRGLMDANSDEVQVVRVFKGKELRVNERVSYTFN